LSNSSSDDDHVSRSGANATDSSELPRAVIDISRSGEEKDLDERENSEDDSDELSSEEEVDEEIDEEEIDDSEDDNNRKKETSSATPASTLQVADVAKLIKGLEGGESKQLKVDDCRAYLRNYGLRISGTKPELIARIKQHIE
jgi:hypothetical protein